MSPSQQLQPQEEIAKSVPTNNFALPDQIQGQIKSDPFTATNL